MQLTGQSLYMGMLLLVAFLPTMAVTEGAQLSQETLLAKIPVNRTFLIDYKTVYIPLGSSPITDYKVPELKPKNWLAESCSILQGRMRAYLPRIIRMGRPTPPPLAGQFFQVMNTHSETIVVTRADQQAQIEVFWVSKLGKVMKIIAPAGFTKDVSNADLVLKADLEEPGAGKRNSHIYSVHKGVKFNRHSLNKGSPVDPDTADLSGYSSMLDWFVFKQELYILQPDKVTKLAIQDSKGISLKVLQASSALKSKYKQFCKYLGWFVFLADGSKLIISPNYDPESPGAKTIILNFDEPRLEHAGFHHFVLTGKPKPVVPKPGERPVSAFKRVIFYFDEEKKNGVTSLVIKEAKISTAKNLLIVWRHYKGMIRTEEGLYTIFSDSVVLEYLGSKAPVVMLDRVAQNVIGIQTKDQSTVENVKLLLSGKSNLMSYSLNTINSKIICTNPFFRQSTKKPTDKVPKEAEIDVTTRKLLHNIKIKFSPGLSPESDQAKKVTISPAGKINVLPAVQHLASVSLLPDVVPAHNPSQIEPSACSVESLVLNSKGLRRTPKQPKPRMTKTEVNEMKYIVISALLVVLMAVLILCLPIIAKVAELRSAHNNLRGAAGFETELPLLGRDTRNSGATVL